MVPSRTCWWTCRYQVGRVGGRVGTKQDVLMDVLVQLVTETPLDDRAWRFYRKCKWLCESSCRESVWELVTSIYIIPQSNMINTVHIVDARA